MGDSSEVQPVPQDPNAQALQNNEFNAIQGLSQYQPQTQQIYTNQQNIQGQYGPGVQQGANAAGQQLGQTGGQAATNASYFGGVPSQLQPFIQSTLDGAYDPQGQLRARLSQQSQDYTNSNLANRGLTYSPYGAGVSNEAAQTFDTNWLSTLLGRQAQGAQTVGSLLGSSTSAANTANQLGLSSARSIAESGALPYRAAQGMNQDLANAVPYLTNNQQMQIEDYNALYGNQTNQANAATNAGRAIDQQGNYVSNQLGQGLGFLFGGF